MISDSRLGKAKCAKYETIEPDTKHLLKSNLQKIMEKKLYS